MNDYKFCFIIGPETLYLPISPNDDFWDGHLPQKSRTDVETLTSDITINWGFFTVGRKMTFRWPWMLQADSPKIGDVRTLGFDKLNELYTAGNGATTYSFQIQYQGHIVNRTVEIAVFLGTPYFDYWKDVELTLKIL